MIRKISKNDFASIIDLVDKLPEWFDEHARKIAIPTDLKFHHGFVAEEDKNIVGFLTYSSHEGEIYISWLAVTKDKHRQGIGLSLIKELENKLKTMGINEIKVETLSETVDHPPYVATRNFYKKMGFRKSTTRKIHNKVSGEELELATYKKHLDS